MTIKPNTKPAGKPRAHHTFDLRRKALHLAVASCFSFTPALAVAVGATLGSITSDKTIGNIRNIDIINDKKTNAAILSFDGGLNVDIGHTLNLNQTNTASRLLGRIGGGNPTTILGTLYSNGKVYLINNAGIVIGAGANIETNGFVATSLNMSDSDFTNGINRFTASTTEATGGVSNAGAITTPNGGFVYLIGPQVENSGIITTPSGEAILAAGSSVELVDSADPSMRVKVSAKALPVNLSQAMLQSNGNIFSVLNSGTISANSAVVGQNGKIQLRSAGALTTTVTSVLEAKGDAKTDGGLIRGFADGVGHYSGSFNVSGRNGGLIETSAAFLNIDPGISVRAAALDPNGHAGHWLLDPFDFNIGQTQADTITAALDNGIDVDIETSNSFYYGGSSGFTMVSNNGSTNNGRITMTNANILVNFSYGASAGLTFGADEKVVINNSSITSSSGEFDVNIHASSGVSITNSSIQTSGGGQLAVEADSGNVNISNSHLTSLSPPSSGASISVAANSGNLNIDNSNVQFVNAGANAGNVNLAANNGSVNINSSAIGVKSGVLGNSFVSVSAYGGNITMTGADAAHSIRAHQVSLIAQKTIAGTGNIGSPGHSIVTEADNLNIGNGATQNAYVTDLALLNSAQIEVVNDAELQLQQGASLNSYGSFISIDAKTALIASAGDITLNNGSIDFFSGSNIGSYAIATPGGILLDNFSGIATHSTYGGAASLDLYTTNLSLDHGSSIHADFVGLNYSIGGPGGDATQRLALARFAKNSRVSISNGSNITGNDGVGMVTGRLDITGGSIVSHDDLDLVVAGDINITGQNSGGYSASISADTEAFITSGGHMQINSSADGTGTAAINVVSDQTLFMNFVGTGVLKDGWTVEGVANAFDSTVNPGETGIFVNGGPGLVGTNTFVAYGKPSSSIPGITGPTNNTLLTNPIGNSTVATSQDASNAFFGKDDDSKDEGDNKGDGKKGKDKPKECS